MAAVVEKEALANPQISFKFIRDGAVRLQTPGGGPLAAAARCVLGREIAEQTIPVSYELEGLALEGLISRPSFARGSRTFLSTRVLCAPKHAWPRLRKLTATCLWSGVFRRARSI